MRRLLLHPRSLLVLLIALILGAAILPLTAQESEEEQKSAFLRFVEDRLSTPERQISIKGLEGVLSEDVAITEITFSDDDGVWLRVENARMNWDQGALLSGRLQIDSLTADRIEMLRNARPAEGFEPPALEATRLEIPQLPVAVVLENLSVPSVTFAEEIFGLAAEVSIEGRLVLEGGSLDTDLAVARLDGPGGSLAADLSYDAATSTIDVDLSLTEPEDGVVANLLNIEGRPEIRFSITGTGPVESFEAQLALDAGGERALSGTGRIGRVADGFTVTADMGGPIADLIAPPYRSFFGAQTRLSAEALVRDGGGLTLDRLTLSGGQLALEASAETTSEWFLSRLQVDARIADAAGGRVLLPVPGQSTSVANARLLVDFGNAESWTGSLRMTDFRAADLAAETIFLDLTGAARNLDQPDSRMITFNADGGILDISATDPQIAEALGPRIGLGIAGLWEAGQPLRIVEARLVGDALEATAAGTIEGATFDGAVTLSAPDIAPLSAFAGNDLSGAITLSAQGTISPLTGAFDLKIDGEADDLSLGLAPLDGVLAGQTRIDGSLSRSESGFTADRFRITGAHASIVADGEFSSAAADFDFSLDLDDLGRLSDAASGALSVTGSAEGTEGSIALNISARVPSGSLANRNLTRATLAFEGRLEEGDLNGEIAGSAFLDGYRVALQSRLATAGDIQRLSDLRFETLGTTLTGDLLRGDNGLLTGRLDLLSTDISMAAALLLQEATGAATAEIVLAPGNGNQSATVSARVNGFALGDIEIGTANLAADITDLFGVPAINGSIDGRDVALAGIQIETLSAEAVQSGTSTGFSALAELAGESRISLAGALSPAGDGWRVAIERAELSQDSLSATLARPTSLTVAGDSIAIDEAVFSVGSGRITASGRTGDNLNLSIRLADVPLSIANTVRPDLALGGTLGGTLTVTGTPAAPLVDFVLAGRDVRADMLAPLGAQPLTFEARGAFSNGTVRLAALDASGPQGLAARASGSLPLSEGSGSLAVTGTLPLSLANALVGTRGTQLSGTVSLNATVTGNLAAPSFNGTLTASGAEIVDPQSNIRLQNISARASLTGVSLRIESLTGSLATGGTISASGSLGLDASADYPADLRLTLNRARYADGNTFVATASGELSVTGALMRNPLLSGRLLLENAEISVPGLGAEGAAIVDVDHVSPPPAVRETLARTRVDDIDSQGRPPSVLQLDLAVTAPNQVFVRGRGIDAELGGSVRLTGSLDNIQPIGGFELVRGRLDILGQRITFDSGTVTLVGDLDPYIDLTASATAENTLVFVAVTGPVSDLDVTFRSEPELPEDEVLSLLIFERTLGDLSPLQLVRLAAAAAELTGDGNSSLAGGLRGAAGLADLDIVTGADGSVGVRAGSYIDDNIYLNVEAGSQGRSRVSIDLDVSDSITLRGSTATDGESSVGIFYEQDF